MTLSRDHRNGQDALVAASHDFGIYQGKTATVARMGREHCPILAAKAFGPVLL